MAGGTAAGRVTWGQEVAARCPLSGSRYDSDVCLVRHSVRLGAGGVRLGVSWVRAECGLVLVGATAQVGVQLVK